MVSGSYRPHEESQETAGVASHKYFALVHSPVNLTEAMKIPAAIEALDKEWNKLQNELKAWDLSSVMEKEDVIKRCHKSGKTAHFGTLMTSCHEKHSVGKHCFFFYKTVFLTWVCRSGENTDPCRY